jgi:hypothetical protein
VGETEEFITVLERERESGEEKGGNEWLRTQVKWIKEIRDGWRSASDASHRIGRPGQSVFVSGTDPNLILTTILVIISIVSFLLIVLCGSALPLLRVFA